MRQWYLPKNVRSFDGGAFAAVPAPASVLAARTPVLCPGAQTSSAFAGSKFSSDSSNDWCARPSHPPTCVVPPQGFVFGGAAGQLQLEFDSDETINHFGTRWWNDFHNAVDNNPNRAHAMVDGKLAVVTGLIGLDCEHSCSTEMHPVCALTIHAVDNHRMMYGQCSSGTGVTKSIAATTSICWMSTRLPFVCQGGLARRFVLDCSNPGRRGGDQRQLANDPCGEPGHCGRDCVSRYGQDTVDALV